MSHSLNLQEILHRCQPLVRQCGEFIHQHFGKVGNSQADEKSLNSLVSFVDVEAEKMLVAGLRNILPEGGFITEENTVDHLSNGPWKWIIDPLDGTTNFLQGVPFFCISIGLVFEHDIQLGIVYDVVHEDYYHATKNSGAFLNDNPIEVSSKTKFEQAVLATGFPYEKYTSGAPMYTMLESVIREARGVRRLGSAALDLSLVARGTFDGYYEARLNPWDVCAGILLVREAGGKVTTFSGASKAVGGGSIIAASERIHAEISNRLHHAQVDIL